MRRTLPLLVVLILTLFSAVVINPVLAQETTPQNKWDDSILVTDLGEVSSAENKGDIQCENSQIKQKQITRFDVGFNTDGSIILKSPFGIPWLDIDYSYAEKNTCMTQNSHGLFGVGSPDYWSPSGSVNDGLELYSSGAKFEPAPAGDVILSRTNASFGYYLGVDHDLESTGRLAIDNSSPEAGLRWHILSYSDALRYSNNLPLRFLKHSFSANGQYLVAQLTTGRMVKIDLNTNEIRVFANETRAITSLAISSDGETVAMYRSGTLNMYDSGFCGDFYTAGALLENSPIHTNCLLGDVYPAVRSLGPQIDSSFTRKLRFGLNSATLTVDSAWRDENGTPVWRRFELKPQNYVPDVEGYLAMGDSFSAGEGDTQGGEWYELGTDEQGDKDTFAGRNLCHLSRRSYPYLMAIDLGYISTNTETPPADGHFHSVACSGALIHNIVGGGLGEKQDAGNAESFTKTDNQYRFDESIDFGVWQPGYEKQVGFISGRADNLTSRAPFSPETVTIGISGNDVGFGGIIFSCVLSIDTCEKAVPGSTETNDLVLLMAEQKKKLVDTYNQIKQASPDSRVYVHGYPVFVQGYGGNCASNVSLNSDETAFVQEGVQYMNNIVKAAAQEAGVFYVDVTNILDGVNLCSGVPDSEIAVNGVTAGNDIETPIILDYLTDGVCFVRTGCFGSETYHPNARAHVRYKEAILSQTNNLTQDMPDPQKSLLPIPQSYFGQEIINTVINLNGGQNYNVTIPEPKLFVGVGDNSLNINQSGLLAFSEVKINVHSEPTNIGSYQVDENGEANIDFVLPDSLEPGVHEIHLEGLDRFGNQIDWFETVQTGYSVDDFDGDGVLNDIDSCNTISNIGIDVDNDGVDDACDNDIAVVNPEEPQEQHNLCEVLTLVFNKLNEKGLASKSKALENNPVYQSCKIINTLALSII